MPDLQKDMLSGESFEASVRQVAKHLYQNAAYTGSIKIDGRERDEIINTGSEIIIIEATKKRTLDKIVYDLKKSAELVRLLRKDSRFSEFNFRILLVTSEEPTADQNEHVVKSKIGCPKEVISFATLFSRLFDARHYIRLRGDHSFGSVRNPADERDLDVPASSYIPTALCEAGSSDALTAASLAPQAQTGGTNIIFGDYGSGKSMTLRDIYFRFRDSFIKGEITHCPIYLNLREHIAQVQPDEALYRHADKIGFKNAQSLISAWRAGYVALFLDGFDELTPPQFAVSIDNLRQARRFAVEVVKRFLEQTPKSAPIFIAGRENYFDERDEAKRALGYGATARVFDLAGFTDADIEKYLNRKGAAVPTWLPTRPLLLGYIANSGLLNDGDLLALSPAGGWNDILTKVCEREVEQIWGVGFEASDLRRYIEGLATRSRREASALQRSELRKVFHDVFGKDADEPADLLAARLPGLGAVPGGSGAREFIDRDFAEAAGSGDLVRFVELPFVEKSPLQGVVRPLGPLGREIVLWQIDDNRSKLPIALRKSTGLDDMSVSSTDIFSIMVDIDLPYRDEPITIRDGYFDNLSIDGSQNLSNITFDSCMFAHLELGRTDQATEKRNFPRFIGCAIVTIDGATSREDLPAGVFAKGTTIDEYLTYATTNEATFKLKLDEPVKVLMTVLRKLFIQSGSGRLESALRRGIPQSSLRFVGPVVDLLVREGFATPITIDRRNIILPNRSKSREVFEIINAPNASNHLVIRSAKDL